MFVRWLTRRWNGLRAAEAHGNPFRCDLHVHSTYSDGSATPRQIVERAAALGLSALAITDHDTACGARVAVPYARDLGVELIRPLSSPPAGTSAISPVGAATWTCWAISWTWTTPACRSPKPPQRATSLRAWPTVVPA